MILCFNAVIKQEKKRYRKGNVNIIDQIFKTDVDMKTSHYFSLLVPGSISGVSLQDVQALLFSVQGLQQGEVLTQLCRPRNVSLHMCQKGETFRQEKVLGKT